MKFSQLAILTAGLFFILAAIWMFCPQLLLTQWGITPTPGTDVLGHRSAALYAGLGVMCLFARHAEPSLARYALAAGIGTLCLILAVSGVVEWYAGHVNGQIVIAVFIELFLGIAFLLSNSVGKKHATGKPGRVNDK